MNFKLLSAAAALAFALVGTSASAQTGPLDFTLISSFTLDAEAGGIYYLRYDETNPPPHDESLSASGDGPLQLVSAKVALPELAATHRVQPFARIDANGEHIRPQRGFWRSVGQALDKIGI